MEERQNFRSESGEPSQREPAQTPGSQPTSGGSHSEYKPSMWERVCASAAAFWILALATFLIVRGGPLDPTIAVLMRTLLSLGVAIFGAVVPSFLLVDLSSKGGGYPGWWCLGPFCPNILFYSAGLSFPFPSRASIRVGAI
jgi:hypothetical protein